MDKQTDRHADRQMDRLTDGQLNKETLNGQTDGLRDT
jgi:hypothetical protein